MSRRPGLGVACLCALLFLPGCQTSPPARPATARNDPAEAVPAPARFAPSAETLARIMALDPEHVSEKDIREVLVGVPAPRIINIHGGLLPIQGNLTSFSDFLVGMGYPRASIRNPRDGSYAYGYYVSSEKLGGLLAWYYEHEGLRPIIVGHSQGGIQAVKVLYRLAGDPEDKIPLWNPLTWKSEERYDFVDPLSGQPRPVVGFRIPYVTAVVSGGLGRALPNQWEMYNKLRKIPDTVEEFTGFQKGMDMLGGDYFGYGPSNDYKPCGTAKVRNVRLPSNYAHATIPRTRHLLKSQQIMDWINDYQPGCGDVETPQIEQDFDMDSSHILWAADVWHSIKKHWVLELQRLLRSRPPHV